MNINPFVILINNILDLYSTVLMVSVILSILASLEIINRYHPLVNKILGFCDRLFEPVLTKIRRYLPDINGIDLSPVVLFLLIQFMQNALLTYVYI